MTRSPYGHPVLLAGAALTLLGSGALWWEDRRMLVVSDLHLGKSGRIARLGGGLLPPYETVETLTRLEADILRTGAATVVCLGDSFDDPQAARELDDATLLWLTRLQAGRHWLWIAGNHDPGPVALGGSHLAELPLPPLSFRHVARPAASGEISGHYHPKTAIHRHGRSISRPCFLVDRDRIVMPAYGTYTGGLRSRSQVLTGLMRSEALAIMTGPVPTALPMRRG